MIPSFKDRLLTAAFVFTSLAGFHAKADLVSCGVDLGAAGRTKQWAVFTLGNNVSLNVNMSGQALVIGDVGAAGTGNVTVGSGQARIQGNLYQHTGGNLNNSGTITGSRFQNPATDSLLNQAATDAQNASDEAWALGVSSQ